MQVLWTADSSSYNFEIIIELLTEVAGEQVGVYILAEYPCVATGEQKCVVIRRDATGSSVCYYI
jgi:hypothetical protein